MSLTREERRERIHEDIESLVHAGSIEPISYERADGEIGLSWRSAAFVWPDESRTVGEVMEQMDTLSEHGYVPVLSREDGTARIEVNVAANVHDRLFR